MDTRENILPLKAKSIDRWNTENGRYLGETSSPIIMAQQGPVYKTYLLIF